MLASALAQPHQRVVVAAAELVREAKLAEHRRALVAAFDRFMEDAAQADKMCRGKEAVVRALLELELDEAALFLRGLAHVQREPVWGGSEDTAAELRGLCALGLVRARHPDAPALVAALLADRERAARIGAANALGELEPAAAVPLLRYKLAIGDSEHEVVGACFRSFIGVAPALSLRLAPELLERFDEAASEAIALELGESRRKEAFPVLRDFAEAARPSPRPVAFVALALLRDEGATDYLVGVVASGRPPAAQDAIRALAHFRHDPRLAERALAAARTRTEGNLRQFCEAAFAAR